MLTTVIGGASSGKSQLGEQLAMKAGGKMVYIATMEPYGDEGQQRIRRHRAMRQGKGFDTVEIYRNLSEGALHPAVISADTVLLECMMNLLANEQFSPASDSASAVARIQDGILTLERRVSNLIVITGDVFSDGGEYPAETAQYIQNLAELNCFLAQRSQRVYRSVAGLPLLLKDFSEERQAER